jgi:hypothetical protein
MTELLRKAFEEASRLPATEQDALASVLLQELEDERRWDGALETTPDQLARLADEALAEFRAGRTGPLDIDKL